MAPLTSQTAIIEIGLDEALPSPVGSTLALGVGKSVAIPVIRSDHDVLVRVLAVALNPTDFKMVTYFPNAGSNNPIGCDFCGIVEDGSDETLVSFPKGTKVFGGLFPYGRTEQEGHAISGAFAEWVIADANQLLRLPPHWSTLDGAAVGGICWGTCVLGLFADPEALALTGRPSAPDAKGSAVLVYGGATATGTMACQLLKL
jgi:NADPH:quinone reductase-like Zn-dependent oxidoreductase